MKKVRIGTRSSRLAITQAEIVSDRIKIETGFDTEIISFTTSGDKIKEKPLYDLGGKALFLKEIEEALLQDKIDIAVHSLKDIPGRMPDMLEIAGMLEREDPSDVLVCEKVKSIKDLPKGSIVGTSSPRRIKYLKKLNPNIEIKPIRGNVETRLSKVMDKYYDATILAAAGLKRLYGRIESSFCNIIDIEEMVPAVGQGVIALEIKKVDSESKRICEAITHKETFELVSIERIFLERLDADCKSPVAGFVRRLKDSKIKLDFMLADKNWKKMESISKVCDLKDARNAAIMAAEKLLKDINDNN